MILQPEWLLTPLRCRGLDARTGAVGIASKLRPGGLGLKLLNLNRFLAIWTRGRVDATFSNFYTEKSMGGARQHIQALYF